MSPEAASRVNQADTRAIQAPVAYATRRRLEGVIQVLLAACATVSVLTTVGIVVMLLYESFQFFGIVSVVDFFTDTVWAPKMSNPRFGIMPLVCGTVLVSAGAILLAAPIGLGAAIFLSEYATPAVREVVKPVLEVLAGIPSVVYGVVAVTTVSPIVQRVLGTTSIYNALSASIVVGFMILPTIISLSEDVLRSVPKDLRSAAYALGATKFDVTLRVVVPAALSGIVASCLLAVARAVGESMAVTLAAGGQPILTLNPLSEVETMTAFIVNTSQGDNPTGSVGYRAIFAVGLTLFCSTMLLNLLAQWVLGRMRERYE